MNFVYVYRTFMKKLQKITLIIFIIFFSCSKEVKKEKEEIAKIKITEKRNEPKKYPKLLFDDYAKFLKPDRLNINSDDIPEYIFCEMGNYTFFDGKTKKEIEYEYILTKYGPSGDLRIIDINCNDNQKEFIIESAGGGTLGNYHSMDIMRFNPKTQRINSIFSCEISSFYWKEDIEILEGVNYIDILYKKNKKCIDTIKIYQGEFIDKAESYNLNIKQKKLIEKYYFNKKTGYFEKTVG